MTSYTREDGRVLARPALKHHTFQGMMWSFLRLSFSAQFQGNGANYKFHTAFCYALFYFRIQNVKSNLLRNIMPNLCQSILKQRFESKTNYRDFFGKLHCSV